MGGANSVWTAPVFLAVVSLAPLEAMMIRWALGFFVIALIAAVLGFGGIAVAAAGIAKIIFYIFLALFVISLIGHLASRT
jgi:uncharacterized membrane protein YtjA (UPF0391 family)